MNKKLITSGLGASSGLAEGIAQIIMPGTPVGEFAEGNILVTTLTDPTMAQAMVKAAGIVTDMGGITSHPAILSREMGIPCVVNTKNATNVIKNGMKIAIDGEKGEVYELD